MLHFLRQIPDHSSTLEQTRIKDSKIIVRVLLVLFSISFLVSCNKENEIGIEEPQLRIVGAWERIQTEQVSNDTTVVSTPYKSIYLFAENYYSIAVAPRERASLPESRTSEDIAAAEAGYISNSGTYKIKGDSIYFNVLVSKFPNFMNNKVMMIQQIELDEEIFILTTQNEINTTKTRFKRLNLIR